MSRKELLVAIQASVQGDSFIVGTNFNGIGVHAGGEFIRVHKTILGLVEQGEHRMIGGVAGVTGSEVVVS